MRSDITPCVFLTVCFWLSGQTESPSSYILGPEDQITITASDVAEISREAPLRVDLQGNMTVPLIGRVHAGGLTLEQLEAEVTKRLRKYVNEPHVTISITEFRSQPVSVIGCVNKPGMHQLRGHKTLFEVISLAEGLRNDAGSTIKITRRLSRGPIPLPSAGVNQTDGFSVAEISITSVMEARNPAENIVIMPDDVISVPKANLVYVVGTVRKSGGFVLGEKKSISALQALALAEGLEKFAAPQNAKIIRSSTQNGQRTEIAVDLGKVLAGKGNDASLYPDDILFVPDNTPKRVGYKALETALQLTTGVLIWRR